VINEEGETDISNLYALGETSCSGLHGANRMASNSLLECFVVAFGTARNISEKISNTAICTNLPSWDESKVTDSDDEILVSHNWDEIRRLMWDFVGIVRSTKRLNMAKRRILLLKEEIQDYYANHKVTNDNLELRNLALVSELIIRSALRRKESRGLHFTLDFPDTLNEAEDNILTPLD
jgi:L-aspartate oxidase